MPEQDNAEYPFWSRLRAELSKIALRRKRAEANDGQSSSRTDDRRSLPPYLSAAEDAQHLDSLVIDQGARLRSTGEGHGALGQRKTGVDGIVGFNAHYVRDKAIAHYESRVSQTTTKTDLIEVVYKDRKAAFERATGYDLKMADYYRSNPRAFSAILALLYLVTAILLVFADIPLALKLTQQGFNLDMGNPDIREFFSDPFHTFQQNWEVFVLAFGIALCTIYIKIFWDETLERPGLETEQLDKSESATRRKKLRRNVLLLTIVTIVVLGLLRFSAQEQQLSAAAPAEAGRIVTSTGTSLSAEYDTTVAPRGFWGYVRQGIELSAFIFITIMFPVIGGICASLGMNCWHNRRELDASKREVAEAEKKYMLSMEDYKNAIREKTSWERSLSTYKDEAFRQRIAEFLKNCYDEGYQFGYLCADEAAREQDLYTRAEKLRSTLVFHRSSEAIQSNCHMTDKERSDSN